MALGNKLKLCKHSSESVINSPALDRINQTIHTVHGNIQLPPKAFAVLDYLHQRSGQLVSKNELLDAVWPNVCVSDAVLKNNIAELRKTLADDSRAPRYIETVHRRGYRFIGELPLLGAKPRLFWDS